MYRPYASPLCRKKTKGQKQRHAWGGEKNKPYLQEKQRKIGQEERRKTGTQTAANEGGFGGDMDRREERPNPTKKNKKGGDNSQGGLNRKQ